MDQAFAMRVRKEGRHYGNKKKERKDWSFKAILFLKEKISSPVFILAAVFLLSNIITGVIVRNGTEKRLEESYKVSVHEEIAKAREEIEAEVRSAYGADAKDEANTQLEKEATAIAKMLYAYRGNTDEGIRSAVWCVLCRVQDKDYPDTVECVVSQNGQWMGYSEDNPVVDRLKNIAVEELRVFHSNGSLPMAPEYVFMSWTEKEIVLRTTFDGKSGCHYWYESDWEGK